MLFPNDKPGRNEDFKRLSVRHHDGSSRFLFHTKSDYSKQFAHIYASRLNEMRGLLAERVTAKWGESIDGFSNKLNVLNLSENFFQIQATSIR